MSCCGKQRQQARFETTPVPYMQPTNGVYFRYLGDKGITVVGPATGRKYDFPISGTTAAADPRDAPSLAAVPYMIQVSRPY
jgi:hypothetical protein